MKNKKIKILIKLRGKAEKDVCRNRHLFHLGRNKTNRIFHKTALVNII
jgi:hypothetical protein